MRDKKSIGHIVRGKRSITSLSLTYKMSANSSFIKQRKKTQKNNFYIYLLISQLFMTN